MCLFSLVDYQGVQDDASMKDTLTRLGNAVKITVVTSSGDVRTGQSFDDIGARSGCVVDEPDVNPAVEQEIPQTK